MRDSIDKEIEGLQKQMYDMSNELHGISLTLRSLVLLEQQKQTIKELNNIHSFNIFEKIRLSNKSKDIQKELDSVMLKLKEMRY